MTQLRIGPINAATPTPLTGDRSLDRESAKRLCQRWVDAQLDGVFILGGMGEGSYLPDAVRDAFAELATAEVAARISVFISAAASTRQKMRERALRYASLGASCVVLCVTRTESLKQAVADVKAVADACPTPCGYYEVPASTGLALTLSDILDIMSHGNIRVIKDSSNNALLAQSLTAAEYRRPGITILDGCEYRTPFAAGLGYDGVIHGGAVLTANRTRTIWEKAKTGDFQDAIRLDREKALFLGTIYNRFSRPLQNIIGQKYAMKLMGLLNDPCVMVDQSLDTASCRRIQTAIDANRHWLGF